jgi:hypothetical protein
VFSSPPLAIATSLRRDKPGRGERLALFKVPVVKHRSSGASPLVAALLFSKGFAFRSIEIAEGS